MSTTFLNAINFVTGLVIAAALFALLTLPVLPILKPGTPGNAVAVLLYFVVSISGGMLSRRWMRGTPKKWTIALVIVAVTLLLVTLGLATDMQFGVRSLVGVDSG